MSDLEDAVVRFRRAVSAQIAEMETHTPPRPRLFERPLSALQRRSLGDPRSVQTVPTDPPFLEPPSSAQGFALQFVRQCDQLVDSGSAALAFLADHQTGNVIHRVKLTQTSRPSIRGATVSTLRRSKTICTRSVRTVSHPHPRTRWGLSVLPLVGFQSTRGK